MLIHCDLVINISCFMAALRFATVNENKHVYPSRSMTMYVQESRMVTYVDIVYLSGYGELNGWRVDTC